MAERITWLAPVLLWQIKLITLFINILLICFWVQGFCLTPINLTSFYNWPDFIIYTLRDLFPPPLSWLSVEVAGKHNTSTWMMFCFFFCLPPCSCSAVFLERRHLAGFPLRTCGSVWTQASQSSASCCHSSRRAHQLNPLSCGWVGRQVSGQHLSLQLSVSPKCTGAISRSLPLHHHSHLPPSLPPRGD